MSRDKDRSNISICVIGNLLGVKSGFVTTQGLVLAKFLKHEGYSVVAASSKVPRLARLIDIISTLIRYRNEIDIVIVEVYSGFGFMLADAASLFCGLLKLRSVGVLHGGNLPQFSTRFPRWVRRVLSRFDTLVAPSKYLADALRGFEPAIRLIPNSIDPADYNGRTREKVGPKLLWMRSFHDIYNPAMAVRVTNELKRTFPDVSLVMAGADKGLEAEIRKLAEDLELSDSVRFAGFLGPDEKCREFSSADIYINTPHTDNVPVAVLEACAMGLTVVSTRVGGIEMLLRDGHNALLVDDDSEIEMAHAVTSLIDDPTLASSISANARLLAESYTWPKVKELWKGLFDELLIADGSMIADLAGESSAVTDNL